MKRELYEGPQAQLNKVYRAARKARGDLVRYIRDKYKPVLVEEYNAGTTIQNLAVKFHLDPVTVSKYLKEAGVKVTQGPRTNGKK